MWTVARVKIKEFSTFRKNIIEKLGKDTIFYCPKVKTHSFKKNKLKSNEKFVLENYVFCFNKKFKDQKTFQLLRFVRGLQYFLPGCFTEQKNIKNFVEHCKSFEDSFGYLRYSFFNNIEKKYAKFISGPFTNMVFKILLKNKDKLKVLIGDIPISVSADNDYVFVDNK
jgi:hypothetical protein|tara:strand:- start:5124 stop:5627 length:504 start_codon:yes stop_codon:yes gene_type:complete